MQQSSAPIIAVIVTYNPPPGFAERVNAIISEADHLVIIDNASAAADKHNISHIEQVFTGRITCIWNEGNAGLAHALNQGIQYALHMNAKWVLLLDHDSTPASGMVQHMLRAYENQPSPHQIGMIAPEIVDINASALTRYLIPRGKFGFSRAPLQAPTRDDVLTVITSGSLIKAETFERIGLMPEHFFIDYIDHDFCLRMQENDFRILLVKDAILHHELGAKTNHAIGIVASHHSAQRRFTIFRNRIWLWKRYCLKYPGFVLHDVLAAAYDVFRILCFERQRKTKLKAIVKGIIAGLRREGYTS